MTQNIYLVLQNGEVLQGKRFGADGETVGELVFTTNMNGYIETLTDPSYYGQIVIQTFPLIGNYGMIREDYESIRPRLKGYIVREYCESPSNFRCEETLDRYLKENGIIGMYDIDTRRLTNMIREAGVMNAKITSEIGRLNEILREVRMYSVENAVDSVSTKQTLRFGSGKKKVVLWDFGYKQNIVRCLTERGCEVTVVPSSTKAEEIIAMRPNGVMLSNGPGDPQENRGIINETAILCESGIPVFGICLGHQIAALAFGGSTKKLKYGHRGANQPVKDLTTGRVYITSQNHGYAVINESLPKSAVMTHVNANDGTSEGIEYKDYPVFTVQFHPEAAAGPHDTMYLFDKFIKMMEVRHAKRQRD